MFCMQVSMIVEVQNSLMIKQSSIERIVLYKQVLMNFLVTRL